MNLSLKWPVKFSPWPKRCRPNSTAASPNATLTVTPGTDLKTRVAPCLSAHVARYMSLHSFLLTAAKSLHKPRSSGTPIHSRAANYTTSHPFIGTVRMKMIHLDRPPHSIAQQYWNARQSQGKESTYGQLTAKPRPHSDAQQPIPPQMPRDAHQGRLTAIPTTTTSPSLTRHAQNATAAPTRINQAPPALSHHPGTPAP